MRYADLILENAEVITLDPQQPTAEAIAVQGDRILLVGNNLEVAQLKDPQTRIIDCEHRAVTPGFCDAHCHFFALIHKLFSLDLSPAAVKSIEDIKEAVRRKTRFSAAGRWISGTDYNEFYLIEKRHPTRYDLDEAAPHHPVILSHRSLHAHVLNSLALKLVGITNETEEPPGGMIDRDLNTGEPNGILYEMRDYLKNRVPTSISADELNWGIAQANQEYLGQGITTIGEASVSNDLNQWLTYQKIKDQGNLKSRIFMMPGIRALEQFQKAGLTTGSGNNKLRIGSLKIVLTEATGQLRPPQKEVNQIVLQASRSGFQVAIHAVESSTVEAAIKALEYAQHYLHRKDWRPRLEHCSECPPELRQRLSQLGAVIVSQPSFLYYSGERYLAQVSPEAQQYLYPFKSLADAGLIVAGSSDSPVVPISPLTGIYAAVTRCAESGKVVLAGERLSIRQALDMYTWNAAYANFAEKSLGSLTPGKLADIVLLSQNPLRSLPEQLKDIRVNMTIVGGEICLLPTAGLADFTK
jgi:predicted amidohydrolase YtcJ